MTVWRGSQMPTKHLKQFLYLLVLAALLFCAPASTANAQTKRNKIVSMKAQLFYRDKGTFSPEDAAEDDHGPPYYPPKFWNLPLHYEGGTTSVFVVVEVSGEENRELRLEFIARYVPLTRNSREMVVRRVVPVDVSLTVGTKDPHFVGFWLYDTGCDPVKLSARILGQRTPAVKRVIKFGCGE